MFNNHVSQSAYFFSFLTALLARCVTIRQLGLLVAKLAELVAYQRKSVAQEVVAKEVVDESSTIQLKS